MIIIHPPAIRNVPKFINMQKQFSVQKFISDPTAKRFNMTILPRTAWSNMAETIEHSAMKVFINKLRSFEYGILNHADFPIGTSDLEGVNNKIKLIKRRAYGYRDTEYFALKIKQAFPGKN